MRRQGLNRRQVLRPRKAHGRGIVVDLSNETAQYRPRPHLNIRCDAFQRKATNHRFPEKGR
jgi:hypothetical protein